MFIAALVLALRIVFSARAFAPRLATALPILECGNVQLLSRSVTNSCWSSSTAVGRSLGSLARQRSYRNSWAMGERWMSLGSEGVLRW